MGKNLIEFDNFQLEKLKEIAFKNKLKLSNQSYVDLAVSISTSIIQHLDAESFEQITSFKL
jgi:hypothetical protein